MEFILLGFFGILMFITVLLFVMVITFIEKKNIKAFEEGKTLSFKNLDTNTFIENISKSNGYVLKKDGQTYFVGNEKLFPVSSCSING
jgi:hypothetical protein